MNKRISLFVALLAAATTASAETSALQGAATQMLKDKAVESAPKEAVQGAEAASDAIEKAKSLKESAGSLMQDQAKETVKKKAADSVPSEAQKGVATAKDGAKTVGKAKAAASNPTKAAGDAVDAAKGKAMQKGTEKALDVLP